MDVGAGGRGCGCGQEKSRVRSADSKCPKKEGGHLKFTFIKQSESQFFGASRARTRFRTLVSK